MNLSTIQPKVTWNTSDSDFHLVDWVNKSVNRSTTYNHELQKTHRIIPSMRFTNLQICGSDWNLLVWLEGCVGSEKESVFDCLEEVTFIDFKIENLLCQTGDFSETIRNF